MTFIAHAAAPMYALPINKIQQENNFWCWAASSLTVLNYFNIYTSQSEIVRKIWGVVDDLPGNGYDIKDVLSEMGGLSSDTATSLSFSNITSEIYDYKRPIIAGINVPYQSFGHAVVIDGYDSEIGYIEYMDPKYPSYEFVLYDDFMQDFIYAVYHIRK